MKDKNLENYVKIAAQKVVDEKDLNKSVDMEIKIFHTLDYVCKDYKQKLQYQKEYCKYKRMYSAVSDIE